MVELKELKVTIVQVSFYKTNLQLAVLSPGANKGNWQNKLSLWAARWCGRSLGHNSLLLAQTLYLVYSVCKIELCVCLVVYGSLTMYRSKEQTSDGFPCINLYNTALFSPCLVMFGYFLGKSILLQPPIHFGCKHSYNTRCSPGSQIFSNSRALASFTFATRPQCGKIQYHLHYQYFDDISNYHDDLFCHLLDHDLSWIIIIISLSSVNIVCCMYVYVVCS